MPPYRGNVGGSPSLADPLPSAGLRRRPHAIIRVESGAVEPISPRRFLPRGLPRRGPASCDRGRDPPGAAAWRCGFLELARRTGIRAAGCPPGARGPRALPGASFFGAVPPRFARRRRAAWSFAGPTPPCGSRRPAQRWRPSRPPGASTAPPPARHLPECCCPLRGQLVETHREDRPDVNGTPVRARGSRAETGRLPPEELQLTPATSVRDRRC